MSEHEIQVIFDKLSKLADSQARVETNQKWIGDSVKAQGDLLKKMHDGGCGKYAEHIEIKETVAENTKDIKELQAGKNWLMGAAAVVAGLVALFMEWLRK